MHDSVLQDVQSKLMDVVRAVKTLPQGYQYKVRELCACIETVVSMHDDIQNGIIPEVFENNPPEEVPMARELTFHRDEI